MSSSGQIPPNIIRGAGTVSREQIIQEQQQQAEQARIDAVQREQAVKQQQAQEASARARQNTVSTSRSNSNVFFNEKTGQYDFIVQPTYDDPTGSRAVSRSDVNPAYFQTDAGKALGQQFDELQSQAETKQDFDIFKNLQNQGVNPGVLTINRNAAGDITGGSGTQNNVKLAVGPNNSLNISYSHPVTPPAVQSQNSAQEASIVNNIVAKANFYGSGTQFGYAISKDAQGNITGFNSTVFQKQGVQQSPQTLDLAYTVFKENQIIKAQNAGAPSAYGLTNGDISTLKSAGITDVLPYSSKPNVHYIINLQDSISGRIEGPQPVETEYYIPDITNPFNVQSRSQFLEQNYYVPNPTVPFDIRPKVIEMTTPAPVIAQPKDSSFAAGFGNYFGNLGETGRTGLGVFSTLGLTSKANYQPEIEASTVSALVNAAENGITGKQQTLGQDLGEIANFIVRNPQYAAGSLAASLLFTVGTLGAGKAVTAARVGVDALKGFNTVAKIGDVARGVEGITESSDLTAQALRTTKAGQEAPLAKVGPLFIQTKQVGKLPFMVESEVTSISKLPVVGFGEKLRLTGFGSKGFSVKVPAAPEAFNIESRSYDAEDIISSVTDTAKTSTKTGTTAVYTGILDEKSALAAVGQKIAPAASTTVIDSKLGPVGLDLGPRIVNVGKQAGKPTALSYTEITQSEANVLKKIGSYTRIRGNTGITKPIVKTTEGAKVAAEPKVGAILEYSNKDLANYGRALKNSSATSKSIGKIENPFSSSVKSTSTSKTGTSSIVDTLTESNREITKNAATKAFNAFSEKASAKSTSSVIPGLAGSSAKAIGGFSGYAARQAKSNAAGVNLGFGGATGAERKAAKKAVEELTQSFTPVPESSSKSSTNSISKTLQNLTSNTGTKSQNSLIPTGITKGLESFMPKQESVLSSLLNTSQVQNTRTVQRTETAALSGIASTLMPALATKQAQGFRFDLITKIPTPSKEPPFFNFSLPGLEGSKKSKKHKKRDYRYGESAFKRTDIVANSVSGEIARLINNAIGPVE